MLLLIVTALPVDSAITLLLPLLPLLPILPKILLTPVLRVVSLASVVRLLVLSVTAAKGLARLEGLRCGLEGSSTGAEASLRLLANVHLLLGLARQVLVLGGRVILPRILDVGHLVEVG